MQISSGISPTKSKSKRMSHGAILASLALFALLFFYMISFLNVVSTSGKSWLVIGGIIVNALISIFYIVRDTSDYSLVKVHWYFIFIFFGIAPLAQYLSGYFVWNYSISDNLYIKANFIILIWCLAFAFVSNRAESNVVEIKSAPYELNESLATSVVMIIISGAVFAYLLARLGLDHLLTDDGISRDAGSWLEWILSYSLPAIPAISCALAFLFARKNGTWYAPAFILLVITILCNSPIYSSRYWVAAIYLPIIIAMLPKRALRGRHFDLLVIIALVIVFPMMYVFKTKFLEEITIGYLFENFAGSYNSVDFDAYSMVARIIDFADKNGLCFGKRLFSSVAYILPGMAAKVGAATGDYVSTAQGSVYTNVSAALPAEGYIDFGYVGVVLYAAISAFIMKKIDLHFWSRFEIHNASMGPIAYYALLAFMMFLMRGALQPVLFRIEVFLLPVVVVVCLQSLLRQLDSKRWRA